MMAARYALAMALAFASAPGAAKELPTLKDLSCLLGDWHGVDENGEVSEERFWVQDDRIIRFYSVSQLDGTLDFWAAMQIYWTEEGVKVEAADFADDFSGPITYDLRLTDWGEGRWEFRDDQGYGIETYACAGPDTLRITYAQGEKSFTPEEEPVTYQLDRKNPEQAPQTG